MMNWTRVRGIVLSTRHLSFKNTAEGFEKLQRAKRNKENRDNCQSKSDPKDALVIADVVSRGYYYEYSRQTESYQRLKVMMSDREFWVTGSVRLQNRIIRWLRKHMQRAGGCSGIQKAAELLFKANQSVGDITSLHEAKQDLGR
ncbi:IS110 family transposase [Paenibacillus mucilaginosus]|uniref:Transposase IS116/IS110/IS902 family protein n=2 Tax=Paenibacillus mucilaginosus TaxID=61624 RepID=H6NNY2_9BACL|nr:transposase [Paenibacillus mucilaginosus]AEI42784.1 transposase IS116/IS110/IS902 family protein [Paenibacillus mucilaginosus KNP414]AFC30508.1 transposase IS116/IS110/IS902 family protein [Paenibacillus mucilaginosus 3016]MCG7216873.1 IS110 family transposase [Paenibacillus mucilaginosus]WDM30970.1 transposase [Paenibacillus mucilaginosus]WFA22630.1 transposase [Paenibacillus mucilaginosus]